MIQQEHLDYVTSIVGSENVKSDKAHLIAFCYDATRTRFEPDAVVFPRNEQDISDILKYCNEHKIVIVPRGAGSGFTGGALPSNGGIILSLERHMNKLLEIDMENMVELFNQVLLIWSSKKQLKPLDYFILQIQQVKSIQRLVEMLVKMQVV